MITLVLGGARSGKSAIAEGLLARALPPVTYVATAVLGGDEDMAARVEVHRRRRPSWWQTVEVAEELPAVLEALGGAVLVDGLGGWLAATPDMAVDVDRLCRALRGRQGDSVVVSEEVGLGVHPSSALGRRFRDVLGEVNQAVASVADQAWLVVAGRILELEAPG